MARSCLLSARAANREKRTAHRERCRPCPTVGPLDSMAVTRRHRASPHLWQLLQLDLVYERKRKYCTSQSLDVSKCAGHPTAWPANFIKPRWPSRVVGHDFIAREQPDTDRTPVFHGYPEECFAYTAFADSLAVLATGRDWAAQPHISGSRTAIVVDFVSTTERGAEASIGESWNGPLEYPMGATTTLRKTVEINHQNDRKWRHLALIATGMTLSDFQESVTIQLVDSRTCNKKKCTICAGRPNRRLDDVFRILARGTSQHTVHLFSKWKPSAALVAKLGSDDISIRHDFLDAIPAADLEANRRYHVWGGTPLQGQEFREAFWLPGWKREANL